MKYIIDNKSQAKDRDVIEIIKNHLEYMNLELNLELNVKNLTIKGTSKKNVYTFVVEDKNEKN